MKGIDCTVRMSHLKLAGHHCIDKFGRFLQIELDLGMITVSIKPLHICGGKQRSAFIHCLSLEVLTQSSIVERIARLRLRLNERLSETTQPKVARN